MTDNSINYTMATYLIDGLNINCSEVTGTKLEELPISQGSGYRAWIELGDKGTEILCTSRLGWLEAAEDAVRQVLQYLREE